MPRIFLSMEKNRLILEMVKTNKILTPITIKEYIAIVVYFLFHSIFISILLPSFNHHYTLSLMKLLALYAILMAQLTFHLIFLAQIS